MSTPAPNLVRDEHEAKKRINNNILVIFFIFNL